MRIAQATEALEVQGCRLGGSSFADVDLSAVTITDANLAGARLTDVNLSGASITNANCSNLAITDANLDGMTINGILVTDLLRLYRASTGQQ